MDETNGGDGPSPRISRRRVLAYSTGVLSALAGCSDDSGTGSTGSPTGNPSTATDSPTPTGGRTRTATPTATPAETDTPTPLSTTARTTSTPPASLTGEFGQRSPASQFAPADGFGSLDWVADRDFEVVRVTSLEGSGEGSLRSALSIPGPTLVVFEVGGVIDLQGEDLVIDAPDTVVAGQTAPSPGITVIRGGLGTEVGRVVVQHLRVRPGDRLVPGPREGEPAGDATDAMSVADEVGSDVIYDHCSASWGTDEVMSSQENNTDVTFSNNVIAEGLHDSIHHEGVHSNGTLVGSETTRIAIVGNVWAHNYDRHPEATERSGSAIVNNVVYDFINECTDLGSGNTPAIAGVVGNVYRNGPDSPGLDEIPMIEGTARLYAEDNVSQPAGRPTTSEGGMTPMATAPYWPTTLERLRSDAVLEHDLSNAGARPADRTPHDERIVSDVRKQTGGGIDSQTEVGGYPELEETTRELSIPKRNVDAWLYGHTKAVELPDVEPP